MGAQTFQVVKEGETAKEAFKSAVESCRDNYGYGGYTGTIAEKDKFVMVCSDPLTLDAAWEKIEEILDADSHKVCDKWGPAGCIPLDDGRWLFFGWASS